MKRIILSVIAIIISHQAIAQNVPDDKQSSESFSPSTLPGNGLKQHDFVYAGEWDTRKPEQQSIFIVKNGVVERVVSMPLKTKSGGYQEFDDASLLPDGSLIYAKMSGAAKMNSDRKIIWEYEAPKNTEIHSIQSIGKDLVLIAQNGTPALALIINTKTAKIIKQITIPTTTASSHGQYRHIRMTSKHTILVPLLSENRVVEYSLTGKELWSVAAASPWTATRLKNGNTLIAGDWSKYVREVDSKGNTVWEFTPSDVPDYKIFNTQTAYRLKNGNTLIGNWVAGYKKESDWPNTVQVLEVNPDKKVVWALRSWTGNEDLGPATHIQLLDQQEDVAPVSFKP